MEVHFSPGRRRRSIAWLRSRGADEYVQQLGRPSRYDAWFRQKVAASLERLDRGEFLSHEEVGTRLQKIF